MKREFGIYCIFVFAAAMFSIADSSGNIGNGYKVTSARKDIQGNLVIELELIKSTRLYGQDIQNLQLIVRYETEDRLHLSITDSQKPRWEVPSELLPRGKALLIMEKMSSVTFATDSGGEPGTGDFHELQFSFTANPFGFSITRNSTGEVLFDTRPFKATATEEENMVFKDQYIQISTRVPDSASLYGLGESSRPGGFKLARGDTYTLWNSDIPSSNAYLNLYGAHPFYMDVRGGGIAHGVLLLNSNGMDIEYTGDYLRYKIIGGVLDFYFFAGPSPISVVEQYTQLIGRPAPMPYWSFGFHQCRWGYKDVSDLQSVVTGYRKARIPLDVMWNDIDYMDNFKDFTLDPVNYPATRMQSFLEQLHASGQRYVLIVDPGIKVEKGYATYERAIELQDIFIKRGEMPYLAQVWPGAVHFPDFLNPKTLLFWTEEISEFHKIVPFDGLWIDMNEVSNFCSGTECSLPKDGSACPVKGQRITECCLVCNDSPNVTTQWENPPYKINNSGIHRPLANKTLTPSAVHYDGTLEYNAHNLYGFSEAIVTNKALKSVTGKRPFILTRSTFVGSGAYAAHWTGDNAATWNDLKYSIPSILNFGLFGIPMIGADICGFLEDTTEELCNRWIQLGAFYPFSRQHSDNGTIRQELYLWDSVSKSAKKALGLRYNLLPYLYTLSFEAHQKGIPIARPLFFSFPEDTLTLNVSTQYLLGRWVLISPVLDEGATTVQAYFPKGTWYNLYDYSQVLNIEKGSFEVLPAPLETINVHLFEGCILPMQEGGMTTDAARKTPFTLVISLSLAHERSDHDHGHTRQQYSANGELFLDNGEDIEMHISADKSTYVQFNATANGKEVHVSSEVTYGEYALQQRWKLQKIVMLGSPSRPVNLMINGKPAPPYVSIDQPASASHVLSIYNINLEIGKSFHVSWKI